MDYMDYQKKIRELESRPRPKDFSDPAYCVHGIVDPQKRHCENCSLVNYMRDCWNNPVHRELEM